MRIFVAAVFALLSSVLVCPASAQTCPDDNPDVSIRNCTLVIQSGRATPGSLADAYFRRGIAYQQKGNLDIAIPDFDQAIRLNPTVGRGFVTTDAFTHRGDAYRDGGDAGRAIQDYDQAITLDSENADAFGSRCFAKALLGRLQEALSDCKESQSFYPGGDEVSHTYTGFTYLKLGQADAAILQYSVALKQNPKYASALYERGVAKQMKGDGAGANADIAAAVQIEASIAGRMARCGVKAVAPAAAAAQTPPGTGRQSVDACLKGGTDYDAVILRCQLAIAEKMYTADEFPKIWSARGRAHRLKTEYAEAIKAFDTALSAAPRTATTLNERGLAYSGLRNYAEAFKNYDAAVGIEPGNATYVSNRGVMSVRLENYGPATEDFVLALKIQPTHAAAMNGLGQVHHQLGLYEQAIEDFTRAMAQTPANAAYAGNRGITRLVMGQPALALLDFNASLKLDPKQARALFGRGVIKRRARDVAGADADVAAAVAVQRDVAAEMAKLGVTAQAASPSTTRTATRDIAFPTGRAILSYDPSKWKPEPTTDPGAHTFTHISGNAFAMMIPKPRVPSVDALIAAILKNIRNTLPDAHIVEQQPRRVNGTDVVLVRIDGHPAPGVSFQFAAGPAAVEMTEFEYCYVSSIAAMELVTYTRRDYFEEYRKDIEEFLGGFRME